MVFERTMDAVDALVAGEVDAVLGALPGDIGVYKEELKLTPEISSASTCMVVNNEKLDRVLYPEENRSRYIAAFELNKNLLEADEYRHYLDDLGKKYQVMDLYFKPYTCCRWGHPAIDACVGLMREHGITAEDIAHVTIKTFHRATLLSKIVPRTADEAQYNIAYPVAAALVYGDFGLAQVREESLGDPKGVEMMQRLSFEMDPALDAQFPARRICRAEIETKDGRMLLSPECEPRGEAHENIGLGWLCDKFRRITGPVLTPDGQEKLIGMISAAEDLPIRTIVDEANNPEFWLG